MVSKSLPASIDESFLDLTEAVETELDRRRDAGESLIMGESAFEGHVLGGPFAPTSEIDVRLAIASQMVTRIRAQVLKELGYTCSAGIAQTKKFAKAVAGFHKPNQQTILSPSHVPTLLDTYPFRKLWGMGGKLGEKIDRLTGGAKTFSEIRNKYNKAQLVQMFDEFGERLWELCHGVDDSPVKPKDLPKNFGAHKSFSTVHCMEHLRFWIRPLCAEVVKRVVEDEKINDRFPSSITVSLRNGTRRIPFPKRPEYTSVSDYIDLVIEKVDEFICTLDHLLLFPCNHLGVTATAFQTNEKETNKKITNFFTRGASGSGSSKATSSSKQSVRESVTKKTAKRVKKKVSMMDKWVDSQPAPIAQPKIILFEGGDIGEVKESQRVAEEAENEEDEDKEEEEVEEGEEDEEEEGGEKEEKTHSDWNETRVDPQEEPVAPPLPDPLQALDAWLAQVPLGAPEKPTFSSGGTKNEVKDHSRAVMEAWVAKAPPGVSSRFTSSAPTKKKVQQAKSLLEAWISEAADNPKSTKRFTSKSKAEKAKSLLDDWLSQNRDSRPSSLEKKADVDTHRRPEKRQVRSSWGTSALRSSTVLTVSSASHCVTDNGSERESTTKRVCLDVEDERSDSPSCSDEVRGDKGSDDGNAHMEVDTKDEQGATSTHIDQDDMSELDVDLLFGFEKESTSEGRRSKKEERKGGTSVFFNRDTKEKKPERAKGTQTVPRFVVTPFEDTASPSFLPCSYKGCRLLDVSVSTDEGRLLHRDHHLALELQGDVPKEREVDEYALRREARIQAAMSVEKKKKKGPPTLLSFFNKKS